MRPTEKEIELMNCSLKYNVGGKNGQPLIKQKASAYGSTIEEMQNAFNLMCRYGNDIGFLSAQKFALGNWGIVRLDLKKADAFLTNGGFEKYFKKPTSEMIKENMIKLLKQLNTKPIGNCFSIDELLESTGFTKVELEVLGNRLQSCGYCDWHNQCVTIKTEGSFAADNEYYEFGTSIPLITNIDNSRNFGDFKGNYAEEKSFPTQDFLEERPATQPKSEPVAPQKNIIKRIFDWVMTNPMITAIIGGVLAMIIGTLILKHYGIIP